MSTSATPPRSRITMHTSETNAFKYCFTVTIYGQSIFTTVTSNHGVIADWVLDVIKPTALLHIGFEYEFDLNTTRIGTLQLCVGDQCLVVQLDRRSNFPPYLDLFLGGQNHTFLGTFIQSKIALLRAQFPFVAFVQAVDLCQTVPFLRDIKVKEINSLELAMGKVHDDWDRLPRRLSVNQVHYACLDAFLLLYLWKPFSNILFFHPISYATTITPHPEVVGAIKKCYDVVLLSLVTTATVTNHPDAVKEWIDAVTSAHFSFEIEYDKTRRVRTLQLCDGPRCLVFHLINRSPLLPQFLGEFLGDHNYTFFGDHKIQYNINLLKEQFSFTGEMNSDVADDSIKSAVWKHGRLGSVGLEGNDWDTPYELSDKQVHFACVDAFVNYHIAWNKGKFF